MLTVYEVVERGASVNLLAFDYTPSDDDSTFTYFERVGALPGATLFRAGIADSVFMLDGQVWEMKQFQHAAGGRPAKIKCVTEIPPQRAGQGATAAWRWFDLEA